MSMYEEAEYVSKRVKNLKGKHFGRLKVLYPTRNNNPSKIMMWCCQCDCGNLTEVLSTSLTRGCTKSCGCYGEEVRWGGYKDLSLTYFNSIKNRALVKNYAFDLDLEFLYNLFLEQGQKCALSGLDIKLSSVSSKRQTASLDRIDSKGGYTRDNVQWVHIDINKLKLNFSQERFVRLCTLVANYKGDRNA